MKKFLLTLITALAGLIQTSPIWAQARRLPTNIELQKLTTDLSKSSPAFKDRRTFAQKLYLNTFVKQWKQTDAGISPFLGSWVGWEEDLAIYPSTVKNQVCIVISGISYLDFKRGNISNDRIVTDDNLVILRQGNNLGVAGISKNQQALVSSYFFPRGLTDPTHLVTEKPITELLQLFDQFDRAGCTAGLPEISSDCAQWKQFKLPLGRGYPTPAFHDSDLPNDFRQGCVLSQESLFTNNPLQVAYILKDGVKPDSAITDGKIDKRRGVPNFKRDSMVYLDRLTKEGKALKITWLTPTALGAIAKIRAMPQNQSVVMEDGSVCFRTVCMQSGTTLSQLLKQILDSGRNLWN